MRTMKLLDVVVEMMPMEKLGELVRVNGNVPCAIKLAAHSALNQRQAFRRRWTVKPNANFAGVRIDPELFDLRVCFEQPGHSRINRWRIHPIAPGPESSFPMPRTLLGVCQAAQ